MSSLKKSYKSQNYITYVTHIILILLIWVKLQILCLLKIMRELVYTVYSDNTKLLVPDKNCLANIIMQQFESLP